MTRRARKNRSGIQVDSNVKLADHELTQAVKEFEKWHWGVKPKRVIDWGDEDMPRALIECGRLIRLHVRGPNGARHPRRERDAQILFSREISANSHVAYDSDHPYERLYLLIHPKGRKMLKERFWDNNTMGPRNLNQLATIAGGRHGRRQDYPNVLAKPVGVLTAIVYYTHKGGDENDNDPNSHYIHQVGEISGSFPFLAVDSQGRLWLAGGNYTSPSPGITD